MRARATLLHVFSDKKGSQLGTPHSGALLRRALQCWQHHPFSPLVKPAILHSYLHASMFLDKQRHPMLPEAFVALFGFATAEGSMAPLRQFMANGSAGVVTAIAMHLGSRSSACKSISNLLTPDIIITSHLKHTLNSILC